MNIKKTILFVVCLALIGGTVAGLQWLKQHQRLGKPGIKAMPTDDPVVVQIDLPEAVLTYTSTNLQQSETV
ncbi:MAG TPA: hypothetical protein PLH97_12585, partial [Verrucomicrobiota bacterium]|nr:hypothetical protein [Verrucomicrobiota bacterium]